MSDKNVLQLKVNNENPTVEVGQFITVVRWKDRIDGSYIGDCLEVLAVDKNLLAVSWGKGENVIMSHIVINMDIATIRVLSEDFVNSIISRG